jgi:hypothetical protein
MNVCPEFSSVAGKAYTTPEYMKKGLDLEIKLLEEVLDFKVYRKTVYEAVDEMGERLTMGVLQGLFETILCHPNKINDKSVMEVAKMVLTNTKK